MQRYYFNLENDQILLDDAGVELRDIAAAQNEALRASSDILKAGAGATATLWNGTPWRMWVTDKPDGEGKTFFTLRFSAALARPVCLVLIQVLLAPNPSLACSDLPRQ